MSSFIKSDLLYAPLALASSITIGLNLKNKPLIVNGRKLTANCWVYYRAPIPSDANQDLAYYIRYKTKPYSTRVLLNMVYHLLLYH